MKVFIYPLLCLIFVHGTFNSYAQHPQCGTDQYLAEILKTSPELLKSLTQYNDEISKASDNDSKLNKKGTTRTIPVVFHIIHMYGAENISKAQIDDQVRIMNEAYQKLNADTAATRTIFKGLAADFDIEFKLARKDPNGNCTEGITRTVSYLTDGGDDAVKNLIRWDYRKYLNIWVIKNISLDPGAGGITLGYATFPQGTNSTKDGIVLRADYVGSIGTASGNGNKGRTLVHEIGHWLGLFHPFEGYQPNISSGCGGNCSNSGDYVCDTPPVDKPSFGCPTTNNTCNNDVPNQLDMVENYMDYANGSCQNMFTKGQKAVVEIVLGNASYRAQNISSAAHTFTGIFTNPSCSAIADFNTSTNIVTVCQGGNVTFKDYSYNGIVTSYEWIFDGGTPATSGLASPVITYGTAGNYKVTLKVTNAQGSNTKIVDKMITVIPSVSPNKSPFAEGFESTQILVNNWKSWESGQYSWRRTTSAKYDGTACVVINIDGGTPSNSLYNLISAPYDVSAIKGRQPKLRFRTAYRPAIDGNSEILTVGISTDCGQTWKPLKAYSANTNLGIDKVVDPGWKPLTTADWREQTLDMVNYENTKNLMIKFEARSKSGNNIYLDNVNIQADLPAKVQAINPDNLSIAIYPNPSKGSVTIEIETEGKSFEGINIFNSTGQVISIFETLIKKTGSEINFTANHIQAGIYFAQIKIDGQIIVKKFIVIP